MVRCVLWGTGMIFHQNINVIKYHEMLNNIMVVGVTSQTAVFDEVAGWRIVKKEHLPQFDFEFIIVMAKGSAQEIKEEAVSMGIKEEKIISYRVLNIPQINFEDYLKISKDPPSILANNCWGGLTYHSLCMKFASPFINMFLKDEDYIKFLQNPQYYIEQPLGLKEERYNEILGINYPVCICGDISLFFNHYETFALANECWEKRKKRINWNNVFVMMFTERRDIAEEFCALSYPKKVCFVPFESEKDALCSVEFCKKQEMSDIPFYSIVNGMASGVYPYYDTVELVSRGRIKKLCKILK